MKTRLIFALLLLLSSFFLHPSSFAQGPLAPPGAPAPTMKSLDQIDAHIDVKGEKRIDVLKLFGDATGQFVISAPGSYYLSGNINGVSGKNGIVIAADNVTLDLNGFALIGVSGSLHGINVAGIQRNLRVHNGSVRSWGDRGINANPVSNSQFDHLRISQNVGFGLACGDGNVLSNISAEGSTVAGGIGTGNGCTLTACYVANNALYGILTGDFCTITDCTASLNTFDGIHVGTGCVIRNNTCELNKSNGIHATGSKNRIEGNAAIDNPTGFQVDSNGNLIIKNSNRGGTAAFTIAAGNSEGQEVNVFNPTTTQIITNTTGAWANFLY